MKNQRFGLQLRYGLKKKDFEVSSTGKIYIMYISEQLL